jgi:hypothetical protein
MNPKIIYDPGAGPATLNFLRPPRRVPGYSREATRHDNLATSGVREAVLERVDQFLEIEMDYVALGSDVSAWAAFLDYALQGGQFSYYPDALGTAFTNYWLEDTNWKAEYQHAGQYTFKLKFRQVVT